MSKAQTDVQFFSHLNGISLDNKWGEMINLLDTCLVNGLTLPNISDATITDDGRMTINFKSAHNCLLFQCVTLSGFSPSTLNDKYRIVGVPSTTQLLLSTNLTAQTATTIGTAVLSPLGYEIVFSANTKRVYRALNPTAQHPFIRVDESRASADGTSVYDDNYAKFAMVGLIENMTHIDDYQDPNKLQLPLDTADFTKNWKISGTGTSVVRGWSKWYWANRRITLGGADTGAVAQGNRMFTLIGDNNVFYLMNPYDLTQTEKKINGCGLYNSVQDNSVVPQWFLMTYMSSNSNRMASSNVQLYNEAGASTFTGSKERSCFFTLSYTPQRRITTSSKAYQIMPDYQTGHSTLNLKPFMLSNMSIPFYDENSLIRGTLKHILYSASASFYSYPRIHTRIAEKSMYMFDSCFNLENLSTGVAFYLGEIE